MSESPAIALTDGPLAPVSQPAPDSAGALVVFEGVVRPLEAGRPLTALDYEAYEPMTSAELGRLANAIQQLHQLISISVEHSVGRVSVGETSFRLTIASLHRAEGLAAAADFTDRMKRDVPLWKKPVFRNND